MYLIAQIWWLLLVAFLLGALAGYLVWRACSRPRLEAGHLRQRSELEDRIRVLETKSQSLNIETAEMNARPVVNGSGFSHDHISIPSTAPANATLADEERAAIAESVQIPSEIRRDNLKLIRGIGPRLEKMLNAIGVYKFDQIASWTEEDIAVVDRQLGDFSGRAVRDKWIEQSRHLLAGGASSKAGKYTS